MSSAVAPALSCAAASDRALADRSSLSTSRWSPLNTARCSALLWSVVSSSTVEPRRLVRFAGGRAASAHEQPCRPGSQRIESGLGGVSVARRALCGLCLTLSIARGLLRAESGTLYRASSSGSGRGQMSVGPGETFSNGDCRAVRKLHLLPTYCVSSMNPKGHVRATATRNECR